MGLLKDLGITGTRILPFTVKVTPTVIKDEDSGAEKDGLQVSVIESPSGTRSQDVEFDSSKLEELEEQAARLKVVTSGIEVDPSGVYTRGIASKAAPDTGGEDTTAAAIELGQELGDIVFPSDLLPLLTKSLEKVSRENTGRGITSLGRRILFRPAVLRLSLWLPRELLGLPWEFLGLRVADYQEPLAETPGVSVSRHVELGLASEALDFDPPVRVLGVPASPRDQVGIKLEDEKRGLEKGLETIKADLEWTDGTLANLVEMLRDPQGWDILHYTGHGAVVHSDDGTPQSVLYFNQDSEGTKSEKVFPGDLNKALQKAAMAPRLVVLNSCEGARALSADDAAEATDASNGRRRGSQASTHASLAENLIDGGRTAVVAMQYQITMTSAEVFAREFYGPLAKGKSVDEALIGARKSIAEHNIKTLEWATPVFFAQRMLVKDKIDLWLFGVALAAFILVAAFAGGGTGDGAGTTGIIALIALAIFGFMSQYPKGELGPRHLLIFGLLTMSCALFIYAVQSGSLPGGRFNAPSLVYLPDEILTMPEAVVVSGAPPGSVFLDAEGLRLELTGREIPDRTWSWSSPLDTVIDIVGLGALIVLAGFATYSGGWIGRAAAKRKNRSVRRV
ncbi:MAG: CHAT domain-containing protein [Longimicrobiales bacterium]